MSKLRIQYVDIDKLKKWKKNPRIHNMEILKTSIKKYDMRKPIEVNKNNFEIECGHGRIKALKNMKKNNEKPPKYIIEKNGKWFVPVIMHDDDEETQKKYAIMDNRTNEFSGWEKNMLNEIVTDAFKNDYLDDIGFDENDILKNMESDIKANQKVKYPIEKRFDEKYDYVIIFTTNELDFLYLENALQLQNKKSYKNSYIGKSRVVEFKKFKELWEKR